MKRVAIITASDSGYEGRREDASAPVIEEIVQKEGYQVVKNFFCPTTRKCLQKPCGK